MPNPNTRNDAQPANVLAVALMTSHTLTHHQIVIAHGKGVCTWSNGDTYEGEFRFDVKWGWGRFKEEGGVYEGKVKDDEKVMFDVCRVCMYMCDFCDV